jgi:hypothetical protein
VAISEKGKLHTPGADDSKTVYGITRTTPCEIAEGTAPWRIPRIVFEVDVPTCTISFGIKTMSGA